MNEQKSKRLKNWQGWLIFALIVVIVFLLGLLASSVIERRAEVQSIFANKKVEIAPGEAKNEIYGLNYPREYNTWTETADTTYHSRYNGSAAADVLAERPEMVILWAGYAFSREYNTPRGHMHAIEDVRGILRTGTPGIADGEDLQPATCWTCKGPDVPRMMQQVGVTEFYSRRWSDWGSEIVNPIGCADCHDAETMDLRISRPALVEALDRQGIDLSKVTHQEMRSLVCAQCHVEYYFKKDGTNYLTFPWDKGMTFEDVEAYYDEQDFYDYIHPLSKTHIIKAQHPDYELSQHGIHAQRGVSCADCHMPYISEGGVKYSDHHIMSPLAHIDRTCQTCHRESEETLRQNVYDRQEKVLQVRNSLEKELAKAHIQAAFAWEHGATEAQMEPVLKLIRESQFRWDYGVASHGASFHAPQEVMRILSGGLERALKAQVEITRVLAQNGYTDEVPMPDISTKEKAQEYIGLDMDKIREQKREFKETIIPKWVEEAKAKERLYTASAK